MSEPIVLLETESEISTITLNHPEKRNALSIKMMEELLNILERIRKNSTRVIILKGAGPIFCTGLDLNEAVNPSTMEHSAKLIAQLLSTLYSFPFFTIAAVHGASLAGGAGLMSVCDYTIAAEGIRFGFPEVRRGLVASMVMLFLRRQLNERQMKELFLLGEMFDTEKAQKMGLINRVVAQADLLSEAKKVAKSSLQCAPTSLCDTKRLLEHYFPSTIEEEIKIASKYHLQARCSDEAKEGIKAFLEKREPVWSKKEDSK